MAIKWDYKERVYKNYLLPIGSVTIASNEEDRIICASCGKEISFGSSYTSLLIHTSTGIGYCVCTDCHKSEIEEALAYE